ncbi:MAG: hypothetical protein KC636_32745, partial [Myxococcales bacterium]|nr:hypothetical protein [Myxococcales bacterium]
MPEKSPEQRVSDGTAWSEFCDTLKMAGQTVLRASTPDDPLTRAEGYRYLSRLTRTALEAFIERADPRAPVLHRPVHETVKMGSDNPDIYYEFATLDGQYEYRLRGTRGTVHHLVFGTYVGTYGMGGRAGQTGHLEGADLEVADDGSFTVSLSRARRPGNWLPMQEDSSSLIVRQMFLDRHSERRAELTLERVGGDGLPTPLTPAGFESALGVASRFVLGCSAMFANWVEGFMRHANELPQFDPAVSLAAHGDPNIVYYHSYWRLAPDEALVIEVTPPPCDTWNFQLNNHWMESLDYRYYKIWVNKG